jgi:anti-anti-sigma factor
MTRTLARPGLDVPCSPPPFLLSIDVADGRITVHGELDRVHVHRFVEAMGVLAYSSSPSWSIDASAITFCDATGLRGLLEARELARAAGRGFRVTHPSRSLRRLLDLVGVDLPAHSGRRDC